MPQYFFTLPLYSKFLTVFYGILSFMVFFLPPCHAGRVCAVVALIAFLSRLNFLIRLLCHIKTAIKYTKVCSCKMLKREIVQGVTLI